MLLFLFNSFISYVYLIFFKYALIDPIHWQFLSSTDIK